MILPFPELPYYLTVKPVINEDLNTVSIEVHSTLHANKVIKLPTEYNITYAISKPLKVHKEILSTIVELYHLKRSGSYE